MKGVILAGGRATRLFPLTQFGISKQLLPVYKQPMIAYPLQTLKELGITEILIINADAEQQKMFKDYLGDGSEYGLQLEYIIQDKPNGLSEAFILGEDFIGDDDVTMILGDNVFIGTKPITCEPNSIFTFKVKKPEAYGVAKVSESGILENIVEKPVEYVSDDAVVGLYCFTNKAVKLAKTLTPSTRGELEIVDLIKLMNSKEGVKVIQLDEFWFDCGNFDDLLDCANLVRTIENRTSRKLGLQKCA